MSVALAAGEASNSARSPSSWASIRAAEVGAGALVQDEEGAAEDRGDREHHRRDQAAAQPLRPEPL